MSGLFRASYLTDRPGLLLETATPGKRVVPGTDKAPAGLFIAMCRGVPGSARVRITFGAGFEGVAEVVRDCTITQRGAWFVGSGYQIARVEVLSISQGGSIEAAWTTSPPPDTYPLHLVEVIAAGSATIPAGASAVSLATADAGWEWTTDDGAISATMPAPAPGGGERRDVLGDAYTATVPNVAVWWLEVP